jgi:hypothetical protein
MTRHLLPILLLVLSPALAWAGTVERTPAELPPAIGTDTELVVVAEEPGVLHWGVNGWQTPADALRPAGTVYAGGAVETPLRGPGPDGRYRATVGPLRQGVRSLEFVLRRRNGQWVNAPSGGDYRVEVRAGESTRRRPITIGRGPWLGRSSGLDLYEDLQDWEYLDCRGVDPADDAVVLGDAKDASRDLVAFYSRRERGQLYLRADLLDLGLGDEQGSLDLVVLIDCAAGGQRWLPDWVKGQTGLGWDLAVTVRDGQRARLLNAAWGDESAGFRGAAFRSDLDAVELAVDLATLRAVGWDGQRPLRFQAYTVRDGHDQVADAFAEGDLSDGRLDAVIPEDRLGGTAKYSVILHGNQAVQPQRWLHDLIESPQTLTPSGRPTGYRRALDSHALLRAPVNIHVSGTLAATIEWAVPSFNDRIRGFLDGHDETGQGALMGGVLAEHIMPYFENTLSAQGASGVNGSSARLNDMLLDRLYGRGGRAVFWIPERVVRGATFADVLADAQGQPTGYRYSVVDQVTHLDRWFGHTDAHSANGHKINLINGVSCFVINDEADQWKFANTDGGLWVWTRRQLLGKALDPDQEQLTLVFDDWEAFSGRSFTSFGVGNDNPDNYETNLRWIANHPWIQVVTLDDVSTWGWRQVDRGHRPNLPLETYDWLRHATEGSYDHWFHGSAQEQSFTALRPQRVAGVEIPRAFGEVQIPGGLLHDVWERVAASPAGALKDLAEAVYSVDVFETAWHDEDMNDYVPKTSSGDYRYPDTTYDGVAGWAVGMQARLGDAALVARAARWSAAATGQVRAWREDVDLDGERELLLADRHAFYAFDPQGGRLILGAVRDPASGRADAFAASLLQASNESSREREGESDDRVARVHGLVDWWSQGAGSGHVNAAYVAEAITGGWRLRSADGQVTKSVTLHDGRLRVRYDVSPQLGTLYVRTGLSPATFGLFLGEDLTLTQRSDGALVAGADSHVGGRVEVALVPRSGAAINHGAAFGGEGPRRTAFVHQVELSGQGSFGFDLEPTLR